jgi:hypothetical protein
LERIHGLGGSPCDRRPDLELDVRSFRGLGPAHCSHNLPCLDLPTLDNADVLQVEIKRVKAASVAEDYRGPIALEGAGQDHGAGFHGSHRGPGGRSDSNPVPAENGPVGSPLSAEAVEEVPVHRPVEASSIGTREGAWSLPAHAGQGPAAFLFDPPPFQIVDEAGHPALIGVQLLEAGQGLSFPVLELHQGGLAFSLHRPEFRHLTEFGLPQAAQFGEALLLFPSMLFQGFFQPGNPIDQCPIVCSDKLEVPIPGQEVGEGIRSQKHPDGMKRTPFVDVSEPPVENCFVSLEFFPGPEKLGSGFLNLGGDALGLKVHLGENRSGGGELLLDVPKFRRSVPHSAPDLLHFPLEAGSLFPNGLQTPLALLNLALDLRVLARDGLGRKEGR